MELQTTRFGKQTVSEDDLILFPNGVLGFEDHTTFKLFHEEGNQPTVHWLQSTEDPDFMMSIISPAVLGLNYQLTLTDEEILTLSLDDVEDAIVALVVYNQNEPSEDSIDIKAIAKAPLVINTKAKRGLQKSLTKLDLVE